MKIELGIVPVRINSINDDKILVFEDGSWMTHKDFKESFKPHAQRLDTGVDESDDDITG